MNIYWVILAIFVAFVLYRFRQKSSSQVSAEEARILLRKGAVVIDVRTPQEFLLARLPAAVNIPLDRIQAQISSLGSDKSKPLLLHCQSGMRSGTARKILQGMGYQNVFNLGSYSRAQQIVG